jgi:hypothetical protein
MFNSQIYGDVIDKWCLTDDWLGFFHVFFHLVMHKLLVLPWEKLWLKPWLVNKLIQ